jgi:hypothetical protein
MSDIPWSGLKGHYIQYIDRNDAFRVGKVRRVVGRRYCIVGKRGERGERVPRDRVQFRVTPKKKYPIPGR